MRGGGGAIFGVAALVTSRTPEHAIATPPRPAYRTWRTVARKAGSRRIEVATRPGVFADGDEDAAAQLLARFVTVREGDACVVLGSGNGLAAAALPAGVTLHCADRHVANVEATRRTLALHGREGATVAHAHGVASPGAPDDGDALRLADASVDAVLVRVPHEKAALLPLVLAAHRVLRDGGRCWLAGGIRPAVSLLETCFGGVATAGQGGGARVVVATKRGAALPDDPALRTPWHDRAAFREVPVHVRDEAFVAYTRPGVFSWDHLDEATALLAESLRVERGARVLDLGCGAGVLGVVASRLAGVAATCVDADAEALRCARRTLAGAAVAEARVLASDAAEAVLDEHFDVVVTNPPFHHGKATALDVPRQFIADAHAVLARGGWLQLVANRTLPYEQALRDVFGDHAVVVESPRFKVLAARKR